MIVSRPSVVRLVAAVIGLTASVWFVTSYTYMSHARFKFEHDGGQLTRANEILVSYCGWLYVFPVVLLLVGLWCILDRPEAAATFEILLSVIWLLALGLAAICLLTWQVQNVPTFGGMHWNF